MQVLKGLCKCLEPPWEGVGEMVSSHKSLQFDKIAHHPLLTSFRLCSPIVTKGLRKRRGTGSLLHYKSFVGTNLCHLATLHMKISSLTTLDVAGKRNGETVGHFLYFKKEECPYG